jgi:hypothetical protein
MKTISSLSLVDFNAQGEIGVMGEPVGSQCVIPESPLLAFSASLPVRAFPEKNYSESGGCFKFRLMAFQSACVDFSAVDSMERKCRIILFPRAVS